ncbi:MAG: hypothetical protein HY645_14300 [Acidobacteria bacterium]|nr:hypothetical protein [Acidobacteriota bacterium]
MNGPVNFINFTGILRVTTEGRIAATVIQTRPGEFATQPVAPLLLGPLPTFRQNSILRFAHFGKGTAGAAQLFSQIILMNLTQLSATARVEIRDDSGQPVTLVLNGVNVPGTTSVALPPLGTHILKTESSGAIAQGSVTVDANAQVAGVLLFGGTVGVAGVGASEPALKRFVAPVETNTAEGISTGIAFMNLGAAEAVVNLFLFNTEGQLVSTATLPAGSLKARGHLAAFVNQFPWSPPVDFANFRGKLVASVSSPVAATVLQTRPNQFATLPVTVQ